MCIRDRFKAATKLADKALKAKKAGTYANLKSKSVTLAAAKADQLNKASKTKRFAAGVFGGATGETFVADVEKFFDDINIFEDTAQDRVAGKLVEVFTQIGIPGSIGFKAATKLADKALKAKKAGTYANLKSKSVTLAATKADELNKAAKTKRFAAGVFGGATGETFVADVEEIGTFGDFFDGPTAIDLSLIHI